MKKRTQELKILKTGQWWKKKEGTHCSVVIFYVKKCRINEWNETRADIETWEANGVKAVRNLSNTPYDLLSFELVSKAEALAMLL